MSNMGRSKRSNNFSLFLMAVYRGAVSLEPIRETILSSSIETLPNWVCLRVVPYFEVWRNIF